MKTTILIVFCLLGSFIHWPIAEPDQAEVTYPGAAWQKGDPGKLGWSVEKLDTVFAYAKTLGPGGLMIIDQGTAVVDWGATDYRSKMASVRKSLLSALYGIHVQTGKINLDRTLAQLGIDDKPPGLTSSEKQATIRMLLQARSGIYVPAVGEMPSMLASKPKRSSHERNAFWYYNNWDFNALGTIFEQLTHSKIPNEFLEKIANPIGMQDFSIQDFYYSPGDESIHPAYHFKMTVRDLARFGYLYLRKGKWRDKQIIPAAWIEESTTAFSDADNYGGYGYLWWVAKDGHHFPGASVKDGSYSARGAGGKYIIVLPDRDLVIAYCTTVDYPDHATQIPASQIPKGIAAPEMGKLLNLILAAKMAQ